MSVQSIVDAGVTRAESWAVSIWGFLPSILSALATLVVAYFIAKYASRHVRKAMRRVSENKALNSLLSKILYVLIILIGAFFALSILNLDKTVTSLLAGLGILGLALGFAFQDIAANFISGVIIALQKPFRTGDLIETGDMFGTVEEITIRTTELRTPDGLDVIIPNRSVLSNPMTNYTETEQRRVALSCGVSYEDDLAEAKEVALDAVSDIDQLAEDKPVQFFYNEFGGSSINFELRFWINVSGQKDFLKARSDAIENVKAAFDANGIEIPYPITTLDIDYDAL